MRTLSAKQRVHLCTRSMSGACRPVAAEIKRQLQAPGSTMMPIDSRMTQNYSLETYIASCSGATDVHVSRSPAAEHAAQHTYASASAHPLNRPGFHVAGKAGWVNDPNGPLLHRGVYHIFYQHYPTGCSWRWGLVWGHAVSRDLVDWTTLPPALIPTVGGLDADGCWSGCAFVDDDNVPTILFTAVRLRSKSNATDNPPAVDLGTAVFETQMLARALDPDDPYLIRWVKDCAAFLPLPPAGLPLSGWRDPYLIGRLGQQIPDSTQNLQDWTIMIGSGLKGIGGTSLVYKTTTVGKDWRYVGELCRGPGGSNGTMWECPAMVKLPYLPARHNMSFLDTPIYLTATPKSELEQITEASDMKSSPLSTAEASGTDSLQPTYLLAMCPDDSNHAVQYYLGSFCPFKAVFDLGGAQGPFTLDLGDAFYAPNILADDGKGRAVMWGWVQEHLKENCTQYSFAGCLSLPRLLWLAPGSPQPADRKSHLSSASTQHKSHMNADGMGCVLTPPATSLSGTTQLPSLFQQPCPELAKLRVTPPAWEFTSSNNSLLSDAEIAGTMLVHQGVPFTIPNIKGLSWDLEITFAPSWGEIGDACNNSAPVMPDIHKANSSRDASCPGGSACSAQVVSGALLSSISPASTNQDGNTSAEAILDHSTGIILWCTGKSDAASQLDVPGCDAALMYHWSTGVLEVVWAQSIQIPAPLCKTSTDSPVRPGRENVCKPTDVSNNFAAPGLQFASDSLCAKAAVSGADSASLASTGALINGKAARDCKVFLDPGLKRAGGVLQRRPSPNSGLTLRVLLDHSVLEVFTGHGEVLTTRVYRGGLEDGGSGVQVVSWGGDSKVLSAAMYQMKQGVYHSSMDVEDGIK